MKILFALLSGLSLTLLAMASQEPAVVRKLGEFCYSLEEIASDADRHVVVDSATSGNMQISIIEIYKQGLTPENETQRIRGGYVYAGYFYLETKRDGIVSRSDAILGVKLAIVSTSDKKCWIAFNSLRPRQPEKIYEIDFRKGLPRNPQSLPQEPLQTFLRRCDLRFTHPDDRLSYSVSDDGETLILTPHKPGKKPEDFPIKEFVYKDSPEQTESEVRSNSSNNHESADVPASEPESIAYNVAGGVLGLIAILGALFIWRRYCTCKTKKKK